MFSPQYMRTVESFKKTVINNHHSAILTLSLLIIVTSFNIIDLCYINQRGIMKSNRGGIREGAGRKPSGKQSIVMRVPIELLPMIEDAKLGLPPKINLHLATDNELVKELERRGFEVSLYTEPLSMLTSKRERKKKQDIQAKAIVQNEVNAMFRNIGFT